MQQLAWYFAKLKSPIRPIKRWIVRQIAARKGPRTLLNRYYGSLSDEAKYRFERSYGQVFRSRGLFGGQGVPLALGEWSVRFVDREIRLPLRPEWAGLDWETAVSAVGHDTEVIQTYTALIRSDQRPALFLDVGANYGMHSILFLSAGIPVIAFEPNQTCFPHFQTICDLNGLAVGRWEQVAIGNRSGQIDLVYPENDSWMGSVSSEVTPALRENFGGVKTQRVPMKILDDYLCHVPQDNVLIAIDVEGFEPEVIAGASQLLRHCRPKIIFESLDAKSRDELFRLFADHGYSIHSLPWQPSGTSRFLEIGEFVAATGTNFIAIAP